jgi:hypothetical protein
MAIWHYDFHLVPRDALIDSRGSVPAVLEQDGFETVHWWAGREPPQPESLGLARGGAWHPEIRTWGTEDGDGVDVVYEAGAPVGVSVRVDLRDLKSTFLGRVLEWASRSGYLIVTPGLRVLQPAWESVAGDLRDSVAMRYVSDPAGYLRTLKP